MFFKKPNPAPRGVALKDLEDALAATTLNATRKGDTLIVQHEKLTTHVDVIAPANPETENGPISAVVTIKTPLPQEFSKFLSEPALVSHINTMASLGAVTEQDGKLFIGSRLTVYEGEDAWSIHLPVVLSTIIGGVDSILGATQRTFNSEPSRGGDTEWTEADIEFVQSQLSHICVCTTGGKSLTAEFGLKSGAVSAGLGDHETALWQIMGDQPHPEFGGGLFCLLQLPHQIESEEKLHQVVNELNRMEMEPHDLPPHFGAWCAGKLGNNPAYVAFLPNALHQAPGIALNVSIWALNRAEWADTMLAALGAKKQRRAGQKVKGVEESSTKTSKKSIKDRFEIEMHEVSDKFVQCWQAAGRHLQSKTHDGQLDWLKAKLDPPFLEHLSFRMGNQLFYVRIDDVDGNVHGPGNLNGFRTIADGCKGHACRMPMRLNGKNWETTEPGWGLIDDATDRLISPDNLITDEKIEMTDWEVHDSATQVVRDYVTDKLGHQLMSSQGNPNVDPSIWFVGEDGPEWIVVRSGRFPVKDANRPKNLADIAASCAHLSKVGHFASVTVANSDGSFGLWRGHGMHVRFVGLEPAVSE
jgi:hypothetical protein